MAKTLVGKLGIGVSYMMTSYHGYYFLAMIAVGIAMNFGTVGRL